MLLLQGPPTTTNTSASRNQSSSSNIHLETTTFSPISIAFFRSPPSVPPPPPQSTPLPPSHDNSWIGARLSPIIQVETVKGDDNDDSDDDDDDDAVHGRNNLPQQDVRYSRELYEPDAEAAWTHSIPRIRKATTTTTTAPISSTEQLRQPRNTTSTSATNNKTKSQIVTAPVATERTHLLASRPFFVVNGSIQNDIPPQTPPVYHYHVQNGSTTTTTTEAVSSQQLFQQNLPLDTTNSNLHPLWKTTTLSSSLHPERNSTSNNSNSSFNCYNSTIRSPAMMMTKSHAIGYIDWIGLTIITLSGGLLLFMTYMDHNMQPPWSWEYGTWVEGWSSSPISRATIISFGAFVSSDVYISLLKEEENSDIDLLLYVPLSLRCITSLVMCPSIVEWCLVVLAWILMYRVAKITTPTTCLELDSQPSNNYGIATITTMAKSPSSASTNSGDRIGSSNTRRDLLGSSYATTFPSWYQILGVYIASAWTGQLWCYAMEYNTVVGCASWGTVAVLCLVGMVRPQYRFEAFVYASGIVIVSWLRCPDSSVYGTTMSALFGWSMASGNYFVHRKQPGIIYAGNSNDLRGFKSTTFMGTAGMVLLVSLPVLYVAFKK